MVKHLKESTKSCMSKFKYDLGIIGLGYVGLPLAVYSVDAGLKVFGFDINLPRMLPSVSLSLS